MVAPDQHGGTAPPPRDAELEGNTTAKGPNGEAALATACSDGDAAGVGSLLAAGADAAAEGWSAWEGAAPGLRPPLYIAAGRGHLEIARLLLSHGAAVDQAKTDNGATALVAACLGGKLEVARLLLSHGAAVDQATTDDGTTPLMVACQEGKLEVARMLLSHGAAVNQGRTDDGITPLYIACYGGHLDVARLLLSHGAAVNQATTDNGATPLMVACQEGKLEVARLLLSHGAAVDQATTDDGATPLHAAAHEGQLAIARTLAVYGAGLAARLHDGRTPESVTMAAGHGDLAGWLRAVAGWPPLRVAAACRLHIDAAVALRLGSIDPDGDGAHAYGGAVAAARAAASAARTPPAQLPWPDALPVCQRTVRFVAAATQGWAPARHRLHHGGVRVAVLTTLLVTHRLSRRAGAALAAATRCHIEPEAGARRRSRLAGARAVMTVTVAACPLPLLPPELWVVVAGFFLRRDWPVPPPA